MSEAPASPIDVSPASTPGGRRLFFSPRDLTASGVTTAVALIGYIITLAPSVTLEDSGEFITAAHSLGVPHPPGYPVWTICAWLWQKVIPFGNVAWRVNLLSAFFSAFAAGLVTLLVSKTGHMMARQIGFLQRLQNARLVNLLIMTGSISSGLILAFSPVMWSQAVISEVYGMNAFMLLATLVMLYRWGYTPERMWRLYLAALLWGVGLTVHQTLVLLVVAFPCYVLFVDRQFGRDLLVPILAVIDLAVLRMVVTKESMFHQGPFTATVVVLIASGAGVGLYFLCRDRRGLFRRWREVLAVYAAVVLGMSSYLYMPVSSATNPPMNWGYTRTVQGFEHHFGRGQYDKVHTERHVMAGEHALWGQFNFFFFDIQEQFSIGFALVALAALFFYRDFGERDRQWLLFLLIGFFCLSAGFLFLSNPTFEKQKQFTDRVFFLPAHCIFAMWIGYGLMFLPAYLLSEKPGLQRLALPVCGLVAVLPMFAVARNWSDNEQRGHDFGYRFGYLMFKPGGDYPEMDRGAVLFGGTDPGRFVPTYMIFVESQTRAKSESPKCPEAGTFDRRDVYLITQNALADGTYLRYIHDHYDASRPDPGNPSSLTNRPAWQNSLLRWSYTALGRGTLYPQEPIWIPGEEDSKQAFERFVNELRSRPRQPGEDVRIENGRIQVTGIAGVMALNGYLTQMIHDHNKDKHAFFVEESYALPWMYPYLEPYGIILRLNRQPLPGIMPEMVARDRAYWDRLATDLLGDPRFKRDDVAQTTFAKLRSAIGGVYAYRKMFAEAEYAFEQARRLCPNSPEANYRLANLYMDQERFADATEVLEQFRRMDQYNTKILDALNSIREMRKQSEYTRQVETQWAADTNNLQVAMQLLEVYARRQRVDAMDRLLVQLVNRPEFGANEFLAAGNIYAAINHLERVSQLLMAMVQKYPQHPLGWYNLAMVLSLRNDCQSCVTALERALAFDPSGQLRAASGKEPRLNNCRTDAKFQKLLQQQSQSQPAPGLPFNVGR